MRAFNCKMSRLTEKLKKDIHYIESLKDRKSVV